MKLGELIQEYRNKHNLSQRQFALTCGVSNGFISMIEKNINPNTQEAITPSIKKLKQIADAMHLTLMELCSKVDDIPIELINENLSQNNELSKTESFTKGVTIPVLGYVRAGYPIYAEENIIDYEEISKAMATKGEFFGLRICGNSMEPRMFENDVVIVRKQDTIESGEIAVVLVNGDEATVKKIIKSEEGIMLVPLNANCTYDPHFYSAKDINDLPVCILGKVVEVRGKI